MLKPPMDFLDQFDAWGDPSYWTPTVPNTLATDGSPAGTTIQTAAVGDLGTIAEMSRRGGGGGGGTTPTSPAPAPTVVTTPGSGLVIDLDWDSSVASAPAGFTTDMIAAAKFLESEITNAVTINLDVGYGEVDGSSLSSAALGESETNIESVSYSSLVAALTATASTDATDASLLASLPATSPVSGTYWVTTAQAKALGLSAANGTGLDGAIGFGPSSDFTYGLTNTTGTVTSGTYDFFATAVHEMTETMGRVLLVGQSINGSAGYSLMDLMHYSAAGTRDFTQSTAGYFSVDGGVTDLGDYNTIAGGDAGDWASSVGDNSFDAYANPGVLEPVTTNDLTEMDAIGWNLTGSTVTPVTPVTPSASPPTVTDQTATQTWTEGKTIALTLPANTFTDPQAETLTYAATLANGQPLPSWLTFTPATDSFSGTAPSTAQTLSIKVTATDTSDLSVSETFTAKVAAPVVRPSITVTDPTPAQTWVDGSTIDLVLPANTFTDALGLKMSFAAYETGGTNVVSWLRFNSATDTFTGTVPANESGTTHLEVIATDADRASAVDMFTVTFAAAATPSTSGHSSLAASFASGPGPFNTASAPAFPAFPSHL